MRYADYSMYIGSWEDDIMSGEGKMIGSNDVWYAGGWQKGLVCTPNFLNILKIQIYPFFRRIDARVVSWRGDSYYTHVDLFWRFQLWSDARTRRDGLVGWH